MINTYLINDSTWKGKSIEKCFFLKIVVNTIILCVLVPLKKKLIQSWQKMGVIWGAHLCGIWSWNPARPVGWDGKRGLAGNSVLLGQRTVEEICVQQLGVQKMSGQGHGFFMIGSTWCTWCTCIFLPSRFTRLQSGQQLHLWFTKDWKSQLKTIFFHILSKTIGPQHIATGFFRIS